MKVLLYINSELKMKTNNQLVEDLIKNAITEDIGDGDYSSLACIPKEAKGKANLLIKENGILAGIEIARQVFASIDNSLEVLINKEDGQHIKKGDIILTVSGKVHSILKSERLVLNLLQRLSGIATATHLYTSQLEGFSTKILDTRKTTPGMRILEKMAVKAGGGVNHRMGLYDMIMLKDNHIDFAGGIKNAISKTKDYLRKNNLDLDIIVEARNIKEVTEILENGPIKRILLDNFSIEQTKEAVQYINGRTETESSGGITLHMIKNYAECGVDFISVGALTHQIKSLDMSLKADF